MKVTVKQALPLDVAEIQKRLRAFAKARDWEQFHTPKNLAAALSVEASELLELFQWLTPEQSIALADSREDKLPVEEEMADVLLYLIHLADKLNVDLVSAAEAKMKKNAKRYPVKEARGNAVKYNRRLKK